MTCLTDREVALNRISKGGVVLRWHDAHWEKRIAKPIDVGSKPLGPLGQIFDTFEAGLTALALSESEAAECGFVARPGDQVVHLNDVWNALVLSSSERA